MIIFLKGIGYLAAALLIFSLFSMKAPKGDKAMSGLAGAAVAAFLVEALLGTVGGDVMNVEFLKAVGDSSGSMGGVAAAILVPLSMGAAPIFAVTAGAAVAGFGILPGFIAGYVVYFASKVVSKLLPAGIDVIAGSLLVACLSRFIAMFTSPFVTTVIGNIGQSIMVATHQSPIIMGLILGGLMKMVCTSPLSAMALTAMLNLTGLPMGIASIACVGGAFSDGLMVLRLKLGGKSQAVSIMMEPLTQADLVTANSLPIYAGDFLAGGTSGIVAVLLGIVNNAPGTSAPIPGALVPFAYNSPNAVILAIVFAAVCGICSGLVVSAFFRDTRLGRKLLSFTCKSAGVGRGNKQYSSMAFHAR